MGDVEHQRQLWRISRLLPQRHAIDAIGRLGITQRVQSGVSGLVDFQVRIIKPDSPVSTADPQGQVRLTAQLSAQLSFPGDESFMGRYPVQRAA